MDFNIIQKDSVPVCPVDASGCFTAEVTDFAGQYVKVSGLGESKLLLYSRKVKKFKSLKILYVVKVSKWLCLPCVFGIWKNQNVF